MRSVVESRKPRDLSNDPTPCGGLMHITKNDIPAKINVPGAVARQVTDFGDPSGYASLSAEYFSLGAGTDIAPLLKGLHDDACHAPHWGFILSGEVVVSYTNGSQETCVGEDLFFWPPGHSVRVVRDAEVILFSPQKEHTEVMDHMIAVMGG
ncbi:MAG: hypothetical protein QOJ19_3786 [Acidimicrobiia bacterium]|jgi:hypothetical protein|nr:hypothetical protein [Acidimicrobiia bacterium]